MSLPRALEAAVQHLERLARDVSVKIDEAAEALTHDAAHPCDHAQAAREATPPDGGSRLDPIDVLYEFVTKERNFLAENVHAQRELERLRREAASLKIDIAKSQSSRIECPRGCRKTVAVSMSHAHGVTPHDCYKARAARHLVPRSAEERWRVIFADDAGASRWVDRVTATRTAAKTEGARVEEYTGPIGEKAERARDRAEHERQWRERREK